MKPANKRILTINGGSSSIKFAFFDAAQTIQRTLKGKIERIGFADARLSTIEADNHPVSQTVAVSNYTAAVSLLTDHIQKISGHPPLDAIGHRVVHGGPKYSQPERITPEMTQELRSLGPYDPEHLPGELLLIEAFQQSFPGLSQIACFDTAFHRALPRIAQLLPIPRRYEAKGIRRYGFHGLSYEFLLGELSRLAGKEAALGKVVFAHLGNGASLTAVHEGKSFDTSMSFSPNSGVPMSTRSGDLDPGLLYYLARTEDLDGKKLNQMLNFQSGLLGISETSSDMRDLLKAEARDPRAAEAVALFCYQIRKCIGAYAAALGGIDTLVFAGGIGENAPEVRSRICARMDFLGILIDPKRNKTNSGVISMASSQVTVHVIPTDEELMIAKTVSRVLEIL